MLSQPLADAINNSISKGVFPNNTKIASVSPVEKQSDDKNKVSNFRPVSVLHTFSKIYESVIKNQLFRFEITPFQLTLRLTENLIAHNMYLSNYLKNGEKILTIISQWGSVNGSLESFRLHPS